MEKKKKKIRFEVKCENCLEKENYIHADLVSFLFFWFKFYFGVCSYCRIKRQKLFLRQQSFGVILAFNCSKRYFVQKENLISILYSA